MKVYVEGYGCVLNQADTDIIRNSIKKEGFEITEDINEADIIIINTCVVRLETENRMIYRINELKKLNKFLVVAGCLPKALKEKIGDLPYIYPREAHRAGEILKEYLHKRKRENKEDHKTLYEKLKYISPKLITPLPICEGCLGNCSYCIVKIARGNLISYPKEKIVKKAEELIKGGTKCLFITAQDTACYGLDIGENLANLLNDICSIEGEFIIRVGMMHPKNLERIVDDLIEVYKNDKIGKFLHLPAQSGDDEILKLMNRGYTVDEFKSLVNEFRKKIKNLCFVTDIIVGFPGESDEHFMNTLEFLKEVKPDYIHGAKYSQRKGTLASKMKQVDTKIRKRRSEILDKLRRELSYINNKKYIGKSLRAIVVDKDKGYTENFKTVKLKCEEVGEFKKVKIKDAKTFCLIGEIE
ncbi:MiaB-like tRNA modifying enzyme [Methanocaldococcus villosus KIN24-T80]|uniref:tRNA-t(6)A37 methylthiotransferase n=1 Tax=Methanocaldococcus villosus KIN24-T80 TaxID=1069083 RepID=N6VSA2_9EURY|nr:tRNA (N(6)-L-threonylcarbamoyladenosine(37)-C(2))-methylthiotransferase [Methanocaldococcus villosus]ENN96031.1 MiaB-like tRNA modifying enzyme [Methanocaldococcus villosus KIN24-T80]